MNSIITIAVATSVEHKEMFGPPHPPSVVISRKQLQDELSALQIRFK